MNLFKSLKFLLVVVAVLLFQQDVVAQRKILNMPEHDNKAYYFGLTFGFNYSAYRIRYDKSFVETDTFKFIQPYYSPGFNLGMMGNLRLSKLLDLRVTPSLVFAGKRILYNTPNKPDTNDRIIESIMMNFPLQLKIKSDRIKNFRFYALVGGKIDYDMAANARSRKPNEFLKVKPLDIGADLGVGFEWYYPNFIFSPEIKVSQGFVNQVYKVDKSVPLSNAIDQLHTRMIVISIHLEG